MTDESTAARGNFADALRSSAWLVILFVVVFAAAAYAVSAAQTKTYSATSVVNVQDPATALTGTPSTAQTPAALAAGEAARITRLSVSRAAAKVSTYVDPTSNAVEITASGSTGELAARIANDYAAEDAAQTNGQVQALYALQARQLERRLAAFGRPAAVDGVQAAFAPLLERDQQLAISAPEVQVAQLATAPTSPSSPKTARNVGILAAIGLVVGVIVADLLRARRRRSGSPKTPIR